jgi:hypothetical protein
MSFGRNDRGYVSANVQQAQLIRARQQEYMNSRAYKEIKKSAKKNQKPRRELGKSKNANAPSIQEVQDIQRRFKQR